MPPLGCSIEFGEHNPGNASHFGENLRLAHTVLARRRVQHKKYFTYGSLAFHDALDLAQLVHQARFILQAAGGVNNDDVDPVLPAHFHSFEGNRVRDLLPRALNAPPQRDALTPGGELIGCRRTESIGRARSTLLSSATSRRASLPTVVVFPVLLTPTIKMVAKSLAVFTDSRFRIQPAVHGRVYKLDELSRKIPRTTSPDPLFREPSSQCARSP